MNKIIHYDFHSTHFGEFQFASTNKGLIHVNLPTHDKSKFIKMLELKYNNFIIINKSNEIIMKASIQLDEYLEKKRKNFTIPFDIEHLGTPFQKQVWQVLLSIPYGTTLTYKDVAIRLNNIGAIRAIGQANKANPISIFIPCHRVVGSRKGDLGGYAGNDKENINLKARLLNLEVLHKHKKLEDFLS